MEFNSKPALYQRASTSLFYRGCGRLRRPIFPTHSPPEMPGKQVAINPHQRNQCDRNRRQNNQRRPQQSAILRTRDRDLQWLCRLLPLGVVSIRPVGLVPEIVEIPRRMQCGKSRIGPQNIKKSGRRNIETPAIHRTKNLHGFPPESRRLTSVSTAAIPRAQTFVRIIVVLPQGPRENPAQLPVSKARATPISSPILGRPHP